MVFRVLGAHRKTCSIRPAYTTQGGTLMQVVRKTWPVLFAGLAIAASSGISAGQDYSNKTVKTDQVALPTPAEVTSLNVFPAAITLKRMDDSAQLVVTGN